MSARDRLLEFIVYKKMPKRQFYMRVGLSSGFLTKNKNIGSDKIAKVIEAFPELSLEWVIMGTGHMICPQEDEKRKEKPITLLPLLDIATVAKEPDLSYKNKAIEPVDCFSFGKSYRDCTATVQIWGESMRPEFCPGDIIVLRLVKNIEYMQWGFAHVIVTADQHFFKRLMRSSEDTKVRLTGPRLNEDFFEVSKKDILRIYEVRAILRKLMT